MRALLLSVSLLSVLFGHGQARQEGHRLGLVLSGGGAKGLAHIGVLKVLEEEGLRPDVITGTSMGSLIGGLYACGYDAAQIEELVLAIHWDEVLTNKLPLSRIAMEEKPYYGRFLVELPFDGLKLRVPSGLIRGQKIDELFRRATLPVHGTTDFDSLPIPFACVATDVGNGKALVLHRGFLADAMRASMALPTAFTPVAWDSLLLVDGGTIRNFPASDARDMGADLIIGVGVGDGLMPAEDLHSAVDILVQASMFTSLLDDPAQIALCDVYLRPDLTGYGTGSFTPDAAQVLVQRGYDVANANREAIRALAARLSPDRRNLPPPRGVVLPEKLRVDRVEVHSERPASRTLVERRLANEGAISVKDLEERLDLLYGTLNFDLINYRVDPSQGDSALVVKAMAAPPERLALSLNYDNFNQASVGLLAVSRDRLLPGSRILLEAYVGRYPQVEGNLLKYMGPRRRFAAVLGGYYSRTPYFLKDAATGLDVVGTFRFARYGGYLRTQTTSSDHHSLGLDLRLEGARQKPTVAGLVQLGDLIFDLQWVDEFRSDRMDLRAFYQYDDTDRPIYPHRGWKVNAFVGHYWNTEETVTFSRKFLDQLTPEAAAALSGPVRVNDYEMFQRFHVEFFAVGPLGERFGFLLGGAGVMTGQRQLSNGDQVLVGGMKANGRESIAFWGLGEYDQGLGEFAVARAGFQWETVRDLFLQVQGNGLFTAIRPDFETLSTGEHVLWGGGATFGMRTPLGVVQVGAGHDLTRNSWLGYFNFGYRL